MYSLEFIKLRQFGSHKFTKFSPRTGVTMIHGKNLDDEGMESNGSGKSHLFEAITKLISNKTFKKVPKASLIMDGKDSSVLEGKFTSDYDSITIKRTINRKGSDVCQISIDDVLQKKIVDKDKWILEKFGINYEDLVNYFVIGQRNQFSIFEAGDAYMKRLLSRFTNTSFLDNLINELKSETSDTKEEIEELTEKNSKYATTNKTLKEQNKELRKDFLESLEEEYMGSADDLKDLKKKCGRLKKRKKQYSKKIESKTKEVEATDLKDISLEKLNSLFKERLEHENDVLLYKKEVLHYKSIKGGLLTCPECDNKFSIDSKIKESEIEKSLKDAKADLKSSEKSEKKYAKKYREENEIVENKKLSRKKVDSLKTELEEFVDIRDTAKADFKKIKKKIDSLEDRLLYIEKSLSNPEEIEIPLLEKNNKKISENKKLIKLNKTDIESHENSLDNAVFWEVAFGNKGFKTFLINKTLGMIEGYTNFFLKKFKTSLGVRIYGFKENANGTFQERITTHILRNGESAGVYGKFSGGERRRIDFCGVLAMRQIIVGNLGVNMGLNILGTDELFEGLDSAGQSEILKMLLDADLPVFSTTHLPVTLGALAHNAVTVVKNNGISMLKK